MYRPLAWLLEQWVDTAKSSLVFVSWALYMISITELDPARTAELETTVELTEELMPRYPMKSLDNLAIGQKGRVCAVSSTNRTLCKKLMTMGIVAGTLVEVVRAAPLGDPIKIEALGYKLSLRVSEAAQIKVVPI